MDTKMWPNIPGGIGHQYAATARFAGAQIYTSEREALQDLCSRAVISLSNFGDAADLTTRNQRDDGLISLRLLCKCSCLLLYWDGNDPSRLRDGDFVLQPTAYRLYHAILAFELLLKKCKPKP